jgi:hypothetical protein
MALIKTTAEMRKYLRMALSEKEASWEPFVGPAAEKYLKPVLGDLLMDALQTDYDLSTGHDEDMEALLPFVQAPLAKFTLLLAVPNLDLNISEGGFTVNSTSSQSPASRERVLALQASLEQQGWDLIETLLRFLEENINLYASWETSGAYTLAIRNLVNSAVDFDRIFPISGSRILFNRYRNNLDDVDLLVIKRTISAEMFDALMAEIKAGSVSAANEKILPLLQRAEVLTAVSENLDKSKYEGVGVEINTQFMRTDMTQLKYKAQQYLDEAMAIMKKTPDDYPEYRDSDKYTAVESRFVNEKDKGIYVFGS